jgi:ketosteroid isomerase-like protein
VPSSLSQADIDRIRDGYRLFIENDPSFLDAFEPDATLVFPETLPNGGTYASPLEALEFWNRIGELFENPRPEPEEFTREGDLLVVLGHFQGRARKTGVRVALRFAHIYRLADPEAPLGDQMYTSLEVVIDTAAVIAALAEEDRE